VREPVFYKKWVPAFFRSIDTTCETYRQRRRMYATRPYLSRATIAVSSPGEAFSLTEDLLMGDPAIERAPST